MPHCPNATTWCSLLRGGGLIQCSRDHIAGHPGFDGLIQVAPAPISADVLQILHADRARQLLLNWGRGGGALDGFRVGGGVVGSTVGVLRDRRGLKRQAA